jgi:hypothetical protein
VPHGHLARRLVPVVQLPLHRSALDLGEPKDMLDGTTPGCDVPCAHLAFAVAAPERGRAPDPADYAAGVEHVPARLTVVHDALKYNSGRFEHHHVGKDARPSGRKPPTRFPLTGRTAPKRSEEANATTSTGPGTTGSHGSISDLRPSKNALGRTALKPVSKASVHSGLASESSQAQGDASAVAACAAASRQRRGSASRHAGACRCRWTDAYWGGSSWRRAIVGASRSQRISQLVASHGVAWREADFRVRRLCDLWVATPS